MVFHCWRLSNILTTLISLSKYTYAAVDNGITFVLVTGSCDVKCPQLLPAHLSLTPEVLAVLNCFNKSSSCTEAERRFNRDHLFQSRQPFFIKTIYLLFSFYFGDLGGNKWMYPSGSAPACMVLETILQGTTRGLESLRATQSSQSIANTLWFFSSPLRPLVSCCSASLSFDIFGIKKWNRKIYIWLCYAFSQMSPYSNATAFVIQIRLRLDRRWTLQLNKWASMLWKVGTSLVVDKRASAPVHILALVEEIDKMGSLDCLPHKVERYWSLWQSFFVLLQAVFQNSPTSISCTLTGLHSSWTQRWPKNCAAFPGSSTATHDINHISEITTILIFVVL